MVYDVIVTVCPAICAVYNVLRIIYLRTRTVYASQRSTQSYSRTAAPQSRRTAATTATHRQVWIMRCSRARRSQPCEP